MRLCYHYHTLSTNDNENKFIKQTVCSLYNIKLLTKKNVMLAFMSGDQSWKRRIRLRTQGTYEKKIT